MLISRIQSFFHLKYFAVYHMELSMNCYGVGGGLTLGSSVIAQSTVCEIVLEILTGFSYELLLLSQFSQHVVGRIIA